MQACRRLGLPYGDQGLLISRALLRRIGGVRPLPLMEDVDLVRRAERNPELQIRRTGAIPVITSARLTGRAPRGFASYLRRMASPTPEPVGMLAPVKVGYGLGDVPR